MRLTTLIVALWAGYAHGAPVVIDPPGSIEWVPNRGFQGGGLALEGLGATITLNPQITGSSWGDLQLDDTALAFEWLPIRSALGTEPGRFWATSEGVIGPGSEHVASHVHLATWAVVFGVPDPVVFSTQIAPGVYSLAVEEPDGKRYGWVELALEGQDEPRVMVNAWGYETRLDWPLIAGSGEEIPPGEIYAHLWPEVSAADYTSLVDFGRMTDQSLAPLAVPEPSGWAWGAMTVIYFMVLLAALRNAKVF